MNSLPIILASKSPRRVRLLNLLGLPFQQVVPEIDEQISGHFSPPQTARFIAERKFKAACRLVPPSLLIAADTIVVIENHILGKPATDGEAERYLTRLSEATHRVITAVTVGTSFNGEYISREVESHVTFRRLSESEIAAYIATGEGRDKAGAYAIQGKGACFIEGIKGCFTNVVGLPLPSLTNMLAHFGVHIHSFWNRADR